jgi:hypothetical protein
MYRRLNITLPDEVLARADAFAASERYTRSGLIAAALESFVTVARDGATLAEESPAVYSAPTATPTAPSVGAQDVASLLRAFFAARSDIEAAWVFGSVARGEAGPRSDVDVAVLPAGGLDRDARCSLRNELIERLPRALQGRDVDVLVVPEAGALLLHRALVRGVRVFGDRSSRAAEAEIAAQAAYEDFRPVLGMLHELDAIERCLPRRPGF